MRAKGNKHACATKVQQQKAEHMFLKMFRSEATSEQKFRCVYCQDRMTITTATADHLLPRSLGGGTQRDNIKGACVACNRAKGNRTDAWFRRVLNQPSIPLDDKGITEAYIRFRINRRVGKAEKRIRQFAGMAR